MASWKMNLYILILITQIIINVTVLLDVLFVRQVLAWIYLTFVPGFLIIKLLKLRVSDLTETILWSIGLSIAYVMFHGLVLNVVSLELGLLKPLSLMPLLATLDIAIFVMCLLNLYLNKEDFSFTLVKNSSVWAFVPFTALPFLSVCGSLLVNVYQNDFLLLVMLTLIAALIVLVTLFKRMFPQGIYPFALLMIAMALLFHTSLISNYIYGCDINYEYNVGETTIINSYWNLGSFNIILEFSKLNSMLSITVLSTIYSVILNVEETWLLKIIYPLIFSFVPVALYKIYEKYFDKKIAFLSSFFFMANFTFFTEMLSLARQMVGELFYVLLFLILFDKNKNPLHKKICFIIFGAALVVSHYSITYIFFSLILFTYFFIIFPKSKFPKNITLGLLMIFFALSFTWYIYVSSSSSFIDFEQMGKNIYTNLFSEFFNPESRGNKVLQGLGILSAFENSSLLRSTGRIFFYITEFFILVGFLSIITNKRKILFDQEFFILIILNMAIIAISIVLPSFASSFQMTRLYHLLLSILSPLFILGGLQIFDFLVRSKKQQRNESLGLVLILIVLIFFFLFQTEYIYVLLGDNSTSISLSNEYRMGPYNNIYGQIVAEQDVFGARWMKENANLTMSKLYTDSYNRVLSSYGLISIMPIANREITLTNKTVLTANDIAFVRKASTLFGIVAGYYIGKPTTWNITEFSPFLGNLNEIYSNGGSEIYQALP